MMCSAGAAVTFVERRSHRTVPIVLLVVAVCLVGTLALPGPAQAAREGQTFVGWSDSDGDGSPELYGVDWDGDGIIDEWWHDADEDGVIDSVEVANTGGDTTRSPRGHAGMRVKVTPLADGGSQVAVDWDGNGRFDEVWWDMNGGGTIDDTDTYETESKIVDNTKATRFRGVFVGVKNGLDYPEKDVEDLTGALEGYGASWDAADMNKLTGAAATPAAIKTAIDAAKADSKPGDEFIFYFSGHGGGWNKAKGRMGGGFIDTNGDETANTVPESEFGRFDGSDMETPPAGKIRVRPLDMDGDGATDTKIVKDENGDVTVRRKNPSPPPEWKEAGADADGDGDVDGADGGVDMNGDGDKSDSVGVDDTILVAGGVQVSDDTLKEWLSGFPESVTIVVILDACHSGSFTNDMQGVKDDKGQDLRPGHLELVAAAAWDEVALERPISNGVLTQSLLDALTKIPPLTVGGHTTSVADLLGNADDRTTTAELAKWAAPGTVTYLNTDNDGDGVRNEDGITCETSASAQAFETSAGVDTSLAPGPTTIGHAPSDDDGDLQFDEDPPASVASFFDVFCDPAYNGKGAPRLLSWVSGDSPFDISGLGPAIRIRSQVPIAPGTPLVPGPTFEFDVRQVPEPFRPLPVTDAGTGQYASELFDVSLYGITQTPPLDEMTPTSTPTAVVAALPPGPLPGVTVSLVPLPGAPLELCYPVVFNESTGQFNRILVFDVDPVHGAIVFQPQHFSRFTLLYPGPPLAGDSTPPGPPRGLAAYSTEATVVSVWANPTDPDFHTTRLLRSSTGFATEPGPSATQTSVYEGTGVSRVETLPVGTYYYTAFSRDFTGNWSAAATASVVVTAAPEPPAPTILTRLSGNATLAFGATYRFRGVLSAETTGVGGARIVLQRSSNGTSFTATSAETTTAADGSFEFLVAPVIKTYYRASFDGDASFEPTVSSAAILRVRAFVGTPVAPRIMSRKKTYTITGTLKPRHKAGTRPVKIHAYKKVGGKWRQRKVYSASVVDIKSWSQYRLRLKLTERGSWRLRAYHSDAGHVGTWSSTYDYATVR